MKRTDYYSAVPPFLIKKSTQPEMLSHLLPLTPEYVLRYFVNIHFPWPSTVHLPTGFSIGLSAYAPFSVRRLRRFYLRLNGLEIFYKLFLELSTTFCGSFPQNVTVQPSDACAGCGSFHGLSSSGFGHKHF